jgi:hypothetical protein
VLPTATAEPLPPAVAAPTSTREAAPPSSLPAIRPPTKWGVHLLLDDGGTQWSPSVWEDHLTYARWLVGRGGWVVELIRGDDLDADKWQRFFDLCDRLNLKPIVRLATWQDRAAGHWVAPPRDADGQNYRDFAERWARFFRSLRVDGPLYVVVGNETNRGDEWGGRPDPAAYSRYLIQVSEALKAVRPDRVRIINGALDQYAPDTRGEAINGFRAMDASSYLDGMQAADPRVWQVIDAWGAHAYPLGPFSGHPAGREFRIDDAIAGGPKDGAAPWPGLYNRGLNSYRWELYKLASYGVGRQLPIFVTETGWRHRESQTASGDHQGADLGGQQAASYIQLAFDGDPLLEQHQYTWTPWTVDADVVAVVLFALAGEPARWGHTNLLDLNPDGSVVGIKQPFARLLKRP